MRTKSVLAALAALAASVAPTPAAEPRAADFAVEKVADGVWAFIAGDSKSLVSGNTIGSTTFPRRQLRIITMNNGVRVSTPA